MLTDNRKHSKFVEGRQDEVIDRGPVSLSFLTVRRDDFANLHPKPPYRYFLATRVFTAEGAYLCTQMLGVDPRAVKYFENHGWEHRAGGKLSTTNRERVQACLDQYARFLVTKVADTVLGHVVGSKQKIQ